MKRSKQGKAYPVIIDFGLAEYTTANSYLYVRCGTPGYVAPEVLSIKSADFIQTYTEACDIFSLGIILHIMYFVNYSACLKSLFFKERIQRKSSKKIVNAIWISALHLISLWAVNS